MRSGFDPDQPPEQPPAGSDPLVWRLAWRIHHDHQPGGGAWCTVCRPLTEWPCDASRLAAAGLLCAAAGVPPGPVRRVSERPVGSDP